MTTATLSSTSRRLLPARPEDITALQEVTSYPCVTVLCTTRTSDRLEPDDADRLRGLIREAEIRLRSELTPAETQTVIGRLTNLVSDAEGRRTDRGIALFVGGPVSALHHLPLEVASRVVVDPTFATRDLVRSVQRRPGYLILVLGSTSARLLAAYSDRLRKIAQYDMGDAADEGERAGKRGARSREDQRRVFLRLVDKNLHAEIQRQPRPVVLAGVQRITTEFLALTRDPDRLAGSVRGAHRRTPPQVLRALTDSVLDAHLDRKEAEVLERVVRAHRAGRIAVGLDAAWLAAHHNQPEMLAVEEGLAVPARVGAEHDLMRAQDAEHPDVLDDAVDELVETVIAAGGWVAFLHDGALGSYGRVVLTLRN